jgi:hypothetical protein
MKGKNKGATAVNRLRLGKAIVAAIKRCELVCNPAVVIRPTFTIHIRRLSEGPTQSWLVSCVNSGSQLSEEAASGDHVTTIHEPNGVVRQSPTRRSVSQLQVSKTKTK